MHVINMASYNYLGFGESSGPCSYAAQQSIESLGVATCSSRMECGKFLASVVMVWYVMVSV